MIDNKLEAKQQKRAKQEAIQKSSLIAKSGIPFFCTILEECQCDAGALLEALQVMNAPIKKKDGEVIRDISKVGKLLITANDDEMHLVFYVKNDATITAQSWCNVAIEKYRGATAKRYDSHTYIATILNDPSKSIYVFKLKDAILSEQYAMLKENGLLSKQEEDEDDILFGDDVFD